MGRTGVFIIGLILGAVILAPLGMYLYIKSGGLSMTTAAKPLPYEKAIAHAALHASMGNAAKTQNPLPLTEANLLEGARIYRQNCDGCHGSPGSAESAVAKGEYPPPPQLFEPKGMVADDPVGSTFWKISNGIRFTGMPGFAGTLSDTERWQVTMLLKNANKLPPKVHAAFGETGHP